MKVLVCIPCLLTGGTEIQTLSLVKALLSANHRVTVVSYFEYAESMLNRYRETGAEVILLSPTGERPSGIKSQFKLLYKGLKKIVNDFHPDIAHVQYMTPGALPIMILRRLGLKKIVATSHTPADIYSKNGLRLVRFLSYYVLSGFQCITKRAENSFFNAKTDNNNRKHFTIYNCLPDYIEITTSKDWTKKDGIITIGVVSRLEGIKGMDLVMPAYKKIHAVYPNTRLLIVGDGSQRDLMEKQAESCKESVAFAGRQPQDKLQNFYDRIDILLMPSRSEGFGLTAIEGMARGCVPVVADTGGLPEVVRDGCDGLLHKPEDVEDLALKVCLLLEDRERMEKMSRNAIVRATDFSKERYNAQIEAWYKSLS